MHVIAIHRISDPDKFFGAVEANRDNIVEGVSLHSMIPSQDRSRTVCVWEADSVETIRKVVEETVGEYSDNEFFEADADRSLGLPRGVPTVSV